MTSSLRPNPLEQLTLDELRRRTSQKWQAHDADLLPLWVAEMDVPLAPPVADAIRHAIDIGDTGYASRHGYAEAVAEFAAARWGWPDLPVADTRVLAEVMTGIVEVLRVSTNPGDSVIVMSPVYAPFFSYIAHAGRHVVEAPLTPSGRLDPDAVASAIERVQSEGGQCVVLLCNPHNPTGTVHTRSELEALAVIASSAGVRVLADEIHGPLVLAGADFVPYLTVAGSEDAISFISASKGWNLAGLKAALAVAGPEAAADLRSVPAEIDYAPSHLGVISHTAAFRYGTDWLDDLLGGLDANRTLLGRLLKEHLPQLSWIPPEGTYLAWLDCRQLAIPRTTPASTAFAVATDIDGPAKLFRDRARVALNSGHIFGSGGDGYVRLNFATSSAILTLALKRMGEAAAAKD
ncbi:cystathionine beta-lyase [Leifsonia sp. Root4]|uniref:MalY/PatB family protein n=1 Tax=Leifsonia sp. Root4 TaxID=1736525 RepID=UPI0007154A84|nr:aminotransferase class I/II-fold pyridoxal phosphate-dependent enzyme [Leifsonia sp. Root4]KQW08156.1 cystathionine beta-lyase [Leifsonia sp. Root4]